MRNSFISPHSVIILAYQKSLLLVAQPFISHVYSCIHLFIIILVSSLNVAMSPPFVLCNVAQSPPFVMCIMRELIRRTRRCMLDLQDQMMRTINKNMYPNNNKNILFPQRYSHAETNSLILTLERLSKIVNSLPSGRINIVCICWGRRA